MAKSVSAQAKMDPRIRAALRAGAVIERLPDGSLRIAGIVCRKHKGRRYGGRR